MDASPTPRQTTCLAVEISRDPDGRLEGRVRTEATDSDRWKPFSGVLELLRVLEELLDHHSFDVPAPDQTSKRSPGTV
jgi:hypothetical protein